MIVLVELNALVRQINDLHFLKQRISTKTLTEVTYACWLCEYRTVNAVNCGNVETEKSECVFK